MVPFGKAFVWHGILAVIEALGQKHAKTRCLSQGLERDSTGPTRRGGCHPGIKALQRQIRSAGFSPPAQGPVALFRQLGRLGEPRGGFGLVTLGQACHGSLTKKLVTCPARATLFLQNSPVRPSLLRGRSAGSSAAGSPAAPAASPRGGCPARPPPSPPAAKCWTLRPN